MAQKDSGRWERGSRTGRSFCLIVPEGKGPAWADADGAGPYRCMVGQGLRVRLVASIVERICRGVGNSAAEPPDGGDGIAPYLAGLSSAAERERALAVLRIVSVVMTGCHDNVASIPWDSLNEEHLRSIRRLLTDRYGEEQAEEHLEALKGILEGNRVPRASAPPG